MTDVIWMITIISKDNVIMVICSVYPLYKSYDETQFEENLTLEMLQSLDLILQCRTTLEAFEASISDVKILIKDHQASEYFQL